MAVYFVDRSHYTHRGCFGVTRRDGESVLGWFRQFWQTVRESTVDERFDSFVRLLGSLPERISEDGWPEPKSMKQLVERLEEAIYLNEIKAGGHHIQIHTDDDELESAVYIFDDHYAAEHPDRAAFLTREDWRLPDGMAAGKFKPSGVKKALTIHTGDTVLEGKTYFAHFAAYDSGGLTDLDPGDLCGVIPGVRLSDLARGLIHVRDIYHVASESFHYSLAEVMTGLDPAYRTAKGGEVPLLKAVRANPNDTACWAAYSDWCEENGRPTLLERILRKCDAPSGSIRKTRNPKKDTVLVQSHVAQASKHVARWGNTDLYHHLIFFDDLWANTHPHLASSLLRTGNRWDVL